MAHVSTSDWVVFRRCPIYFISLSLSDDESSLRVNDRNDEAYRTPPGKLYLACRVASPRGRYYNAPNLNGAWSGSNRRKAQQLEDSRMSTPIRWKQRGRVNSYGSAPRTDTPLRALALNLTQAARAAFTEPYMLTVEHQRVDLNRLPKALEGLHIVQLSDVHHGPFSSKEQ